MTTNTELETINPNEPMYELLRTLLPRLHGGVEYLRYRDPEANNEELLNAIIQQACNAQRPLNGLVKAIGACMASAECDSEIDTTALVDLGGGLQLLGELNSALDSVRGEARSLLDHPPAHTEIDN